MVVCDSFAGEKSDENQMNMKKRLYISLLALQATLFTNLVWAQAPTDTTATDSVPRELSWTEKFQQRLNPLIQEAERAPFYSGICIYDLTADSLLFGYNQQKVMRPASTQKVLTAVTALAVLGKNHQYTTRAYYDGTITADTTVVQIVIPAPTFPDKEGVIADSVIRDSVIIKRTLHGNVCVVGDFDPLFSYNDLKDIAGSLQKLHIDSITGRLIADVSMKDTLRWGNGWCWDDVPSDYMPALTPIMFNNQERLNSKDTNYLIYPDHYFMETLAREIRERGIYISISNSNFRFTSYPSDTRKGTEFFSCSHTIEQVLQRMMKRSSNLFAESMFYQLAALSKKSGSTWKDGAKQVEQMVARAGGNTTQLEVVDGSGVSLYDYVTPETEVMMLRFAYRNNAIYNALYPALPIAGVDGTLQKRMLTGPAHANVHAKTGTVEGVSCLAGYVKASNGHILAFSIMNNGVLKSSVGRDFQDRLCQMMAQ